MAMRISGPCAAEAAERSIEVTAAGHVLEVVIRPPYPAPPLGPQRGSVGCQGLVDTGASDVCIDFRIADALGLPEIDLRRVGVPGSSLLASVRMGRLEVPLLGFSELLPLYAFKMRHATHEAILGRSFLRSYIVTFHGPLGVMTFSDPGAAAEELNPDD